MIRNTNSNSEWTINELTTYNIAIEDIDKTIFLVNKSPKNIKLCKFLKGILFVKPEQDGEDNKILEIFTHTPTETDANQESAVNEYILQSLRVFEYTRTKLAIRPQRDTILHTPKEGTHTKPDMYFSGNKSILIGVQGNKVQIILKDSGPELITKAIESSQNNDKI
ncbi:hypothetical protein K502DRAFT_349312 [Neoconidiobolus thromboides FSU 785]|nr:hypothetical protein K502DRAFT_349312 [Neoconidiobolus thromboides FSU 785]